MRSTLIDREIALCRAELQRMNLGVSGDPESPPPNPSRKDPGYRPLRWDGRHHQEDISRGKAIIRVLITKLTFKRNRYQYFWRKTPTVYEWDWFRNDEKLGSAKIGEFGTVDLSYDAIDGRSKRTPRLRNESEAEAEVPFMLRSVGIEAALPAPEPRRRPRSRSRSRHSTREPLTTAHADTAEIIGILNKKFAAKGYTYKETTDNGLTFSNWRNSSGKKMADATAHNHGVILHIFNADKSFTDFHLQTPEDAEAIKI